MPRPDLRGLGVLVTRPAHQAGALCELIEQAGGRAIRFPVLEIEASHDAATEACLDRLAEYDLLVFVSPNAVQHGMERVAVHGGLPTGLKLAVVGEGSARALEARTGRRADVCPAERYETEGLLALPGLQDMRGRRVLILRGQDGRGLLGETLRERGAVVDYAEVYRRRLPRADKGRLASLLAAGEVDWLTVTSSEGLRNLLLLAGSENARDLLKLPIVVVSERTAALATELGFVHPARIAMPISDQGILMAVAQESGEKNNE